MPVAEVAANFQKTSTPSHRARRYPGDADAFILSHGTQRAKFVRQGADRPQSLCRLSALRGDRVTLSGRQEDRRRGGAQAPVERLAKPIQILRKLI